MRTEVAAEVGQVERDVAGRVQEVAGVQLKVHAVRFQLRGGGSVSVSERMLVPRCGVHPAGAQRGAELAQGGAVRRGGEQQRRGEAAAQVGIERRQRGVKPHA